MMRLQAIWTQIKLVVVFAWLYGWLAVVREPFWLVSSLLTPISIVVIMTVFGGLHYMYFGLLGGLAMAVSSSGGFTIIGDATYLRLELKFQSMLLNTRLNPVSYTLGLALSELTYALPGLAVFILLIQAMLREPASIYLLAVSVLALEWVTASMLGFTLSTFLRCEIRLVPVWDTGLPAGYLASGILPSLPTTHTIHSPSITSQHSIHSTTVPNAEG